MSLKQRLDEIGKVYLLRDDKGVSAQASLKTPLLSFSLKDNLLPNGSATAPPLAIVVGSGITGPARRETPPSRFFGNTLSTGAGLVVLIAIFGPLSGAHLDPAVTLVFASAELPGQSRWYCATLDRGRCLPRPQCRY